MTFIPEAGAHPFGYCHRCEREITREESRDRSHECVTSTVVVYLEGGVIQSVTASDPRVAVIVIDFDVDNDDDAHVYEDNRGKLEKVWATEWTPEKAEADEITRARIASVTDWPALAGADRFAV